MGVIERKQREKLRRKKKIRASAKKLFREHGFNNTTLEAIGGEVEISTSIIYHFYSSKKDLYIDVLTTIMENLYRRLLHIEKQGNANSKDKVDLLLAAVLEIYSEEPTLTMGLFQLLSQAHNYEDSAGNMLKIQHLFKKNKDLSNNIFEDSNLKNLNQHLDPKIITDIFWSTVIGACLSDAGQFNLYGTEKDLGKKFESIFEIFKNGVQYMPRQ
jgi:AcrR family transcriptional regulator